MKVEADGDLHIALRDATGDKLASLFMKCQQSLSGARLAKWFSVGADIGHARKDGSNRPKRLRDYAVCEIHPVMQLRV